jgi:putative MATE family efflux protein
MRFRPSYRSIWGISFPIIIAGVSETIVDITDTIFLAHYGITELAAIGMADAIYGLSLFLIMGLVDGIQIIIGRRAGQEQRHEIGRTFNQGLYLLLLASLLSLLLILVAVPAITDTLLASHEVHNAVNRYLHIAAFALFFQSTNLALSAFYVGISRTRVLIGGAIILAITNISLDYLLIYGNFGLPEMGIEGAAIATLSSEIATFLFLFAEVLRKRYDLSYHLFRLSKWNMALAQHLVSISMPVSLETLVSMAKWFLLVVIIEQLGEETLAGANIILSCYALFIIPVESFSETICSMISNLIGQHHEKRLRLLIRRTINLSYSVVVPMLALTLLFPDQVLSLFTPDKEIIAASHYGLIVMVCITLIAVPAETYYSAVAGTGDTRIILAIQCIVTLVTLTYAWYAALIAELPLQYILLAEMLGATTCLVLSWLWFRSGRWNRLNI